MSKRKLLFASALILTGIAAAVSAFRLVSYGFNNPPTGVGIADPALTAEQFCSALNEWDHEAISGMTGNYDAADFDFELDSPLEAKLHDCLTDSFACELSEKGTVEGMNASYDMSVSYFVFSRAADDIRKYTQRHYDELLASGQDNSDLYDKNGNLLESVAMDLYENAVEIVISDKDKYISTRDLTLDLVYENGRWDVMLSEELIDVLLGKAAQ